MGASGRGRPREDQAAGRARPRRSCSDLLSEDPERRRPARLPAAAAPATDRHLVSTPTHSPGDSMQTPTRPNSPITPLARKSAGATSRSARPRTALRPRHLEHTPSHGCAPYGTGSPCGRRAPGPSASWRTAVNSRPARPTAIHTRTASPSTRRNQFAPAAVSSPAHTARPIVKTARPTSCVAPLVAAASPTPRTRRAAAGSGTARSGSVAASLAAAPPELGGGQHATFSQRFGCRHVVLRP